MKNENRSWTRITTLFLSLCSPLLLFGCTSIQVAGDVQTGRQALLAGKPNEALSHFRRAADRSPDYVLNFSLADEAIWTYVGRAYYDMGKLPEARQALEQARSRYGHDMLAGLYLGLVMVREGDRQKGLKEIEASVKGLGDWVDYIDQSHPDGQFWDPGRDLRSAVQENLAMISRKDINWPQLIASAEGFGKKCEQEIDFARQQKVEELHGDGD